jgi:hypothetical protein
VGIQRRLIFHFLGAVIQEIITDPLIIQPRTVHLQILLQQTTLPRVAHHLIIRAARLLTTKDLHLQTAQGTVHQPTIKEAIHHLAQEVEMGDREADQQQMGMEAEEVLALDRSLLILEAFQLLSDLRKS